MSPARPLHHRAARSPAESCEAESSPLGELYRRSRAREFGISPPQFHGVLEEVGRKYLPPDASPADRQRLFESLRVEELALARGCAAGNETAWEWFLLRYREKLYEVAGYIARESSAARELADSLYADLYGTRTRDGMRVSKLTSYTGRGSLEGWLRTVMAQEYVNRYRRQRRLVSLDEQSEEGVQFAAATQTPAVSIDSRIEEAADEVLGLLPAGDRFVLASYYLDGRTLAEIARALGVHESTISRKLDKLAKSMRKQILAALGRRGMGRREAREALEIDVRDLTLNIRGRLTQEPVAEAFSEKSGRPSGR